MDNQTLKYRGQSGAARTWGEAGGEEVEPPVMVRNGQQEWSVVTLHSRLTVGEAATRRQRRAGPGVLTHRAAHPALREMVCPVSSNNKDI